MSNDKVGLIVFAGDSYTQLPITSDYISARMFVNDLSTDMVPTQGTAIGTAIDMAVNSFTPESDFQKAIVLLTDGENFEDNAVEAAKKQLKQVFRWMLSVLALHQVHQSPLSVKVTNICLMHRVIR